MHVLRSTASQPDLVTGENKLRDTAAQFEALMWSQILRFARCDADGDATSESIRDLADQQLANILAASGALGIAKLTIQGFSQSTGPQ